jgi:hypothetical protein
VCGRGHFEGCPDLRTLFVAYNEVRWVGGMTSRRERMFDGPRLMRRRSRSTRLARWLPPILQVVRNRAADNKRLVPIEGQVMDHILSRSRPSPSWLDREVSHSQYGERG